MTTFTPIDLSRLPDPQVVEALDYETILAERKATMVALWPDAEQPAIAALLELESEPLTKLLQENAYRELLWRRRVNEAALATLLAKARDSDLDQVAAGYEVQRLTITPATDDAQAVMEGDDSLRERAQMSWEGLSSAGARNAYIFHARSADGRVADATATSPSPAVVVVTVQTATGDGSADQDLLDVVTDHLSDEDRRPVADRLIVQGAEVMTYAINAVLYLNTAGPESAPILAAANARLAATINPRRRLGVEVTASALHAALHVEGVRRVDLLDWQDIIPSAAQAAYCTGYQLAVGD